MFSYTNEDIIRVVNNYYKGISLSDISMEYKIPVASIYYFMKLVR